ncbi:uncharacterized protein LOC124207387 [Daphnia pulex]|uniref:uncharacterized protein LOC124202115 n=1 Tax=Daphnia pulex TaxID=6669 RepID=UPI001EDCF97B|nr:uncharacterized protein LOC124202115 [Daphnia pulex]XP_046460762.1 uncharacterized protein LOC124207387 [Daphnia pulex]
MAQNYSLDAIKHLRKFDGTQFTTWKHNMEMLFTLKQLRQFIQGEDNEPQEIFAGEGDLRVVTNQELINQWKTTDCYGRFLIFNCCDETRKLALLNCRTSYDMWTRLETQYLQRAADNKHLLHRDFMNLRPVDNQDIMIHITELESKAAELNDLGVMVSEHHLITTILCSLPERFANLTSIWDNLPDADRTMVALRARIVGEERRFNNSQGQSNARSLILNSDTGPPDNSIESSALFGNDSRGRGHFRGGRGQSRGHMSSEINRDLVSCSYCGKDRHLEFECRTRISNENEKTKSSSFHYKRPKDDRDTTNSSGKKVDFSLISSCCLTAKNSKDIYLDSGATRHMSGDESMLTDLRIIADNSWPVNGIGGTVLYARGIGTMRLVRHVDDSSTFREVKEVLFVPGLGVNLISIGCLTKSGFTVSFSGLQAIIKRNKTTILTASRFGETLYRAEATLAPLTDVRLAASPATVATMHHIPYCQLVGSNMYAALKVRLEIRPDVIFMASQLAQHLHNPTIIHWKAAKRILQYLGTTRYHGLEFGSKGHDNTTVVAFSDVDHAGDADSKRTTTGYILALNGRAISWCSQRQPVVATSTM